MGVSLGLKFTSSYRERKRIFDVLFLLFFSSFYFWLLYTVYLNFILLYFFRIRLVAVATQKFVAEVATDAIQYASELFLCFIIYAHTDTCRYTKIDMQMHNSEVFYGFRV